MGWPCTMNSLSSMLVGLCFEYVALREAHLSGRNSKPIKLAVSLAASRSF